MSVTVDVADSPNVRLTRQDVAAEAPDAVAFAVEGRATVPAGSLASFEGRNLRPVAVTLAVEGSPVVVELGDGAELRLEAVDVGVETPDAGDLPTGVDDPGSAATDVVGGIDVDAAVLAFTVEGTVTGVAPEPFEALARAPPTIESITFEVDDPVATDGGPDDGVLVEFAVLGLRIAVRRDGSITVGRR